MQDLTRRRVNLHPAPALAEAVTVSRFWRAVDVSAADQCWPWQGDTDKNGYGVFFYPGRIRGAHELALSFSTGEARTEGMETCHSCDNSTCCNPHHLRFDTRRSNIKDMHERGRAARSGRLTDREIIAIRERRSNGARQKDLAEHFGVTDGSVSMIVRGIRWASVGGPIETKRSQYRNGTDCATGATERTRPTDAASTSGAGASPR